VQHGVAPDAKDHRVESGVILPIADVVDLELFPRFALLAAVASTNESGMTNG